MGLPPMQLLKLFVGSTEYHTPKVVDATVLKDWESFLLRQYGHFRKSEVSASMRLDDTGLTLNEELLVYEIGLLEPVDLDQLNTDCHQWANRLKLYTIGIMIQPADYMSV